MKNQEYTFADLQRFASLLNAEIAEKYKVEGFSEKVYGRLTKLMEESGELANAVACYFNRQREEKLSGTDKKQDIALEIADVLIVVFGIGELLGIDLKEAVQTKVAKIINHTHGDRYSEIRDDYFLEINK